MSDLSEFFEKLATDAQLMEAYQQDPEAVMKSAGLTDEAISAVMSGDKAAIDKLSGNTSEFFHYQIVTSHKD
ncbi:hypothetical protein [Shewanella sp. Isolate11]|uniref:hypothetical protein n=1 Tax=Shewanella sp. Isolate11 TaxID=2908530 RepID=UPI001EFD03DC|nr:hypothetical protein [Shewanella sp. Isolate11]MCG9697227.1 hypothetical protein [Shewanella sp. Isolate11]